MVDLTEATLLVAASTLILAIVSYSSVRQNRRQVEILARQTMILRSQSDPILIANSIGFEGNTMNIKVLNNGTGPASGLAVDVSVLLCRLEFTKDKEGKQIITPSEMASLPKGTMGYPHYHLLRDQHLLLEGKRKYFVALANELLKEGPSAMMLLPKEEHGYKVNLKFALGNSSKDPDHWLIYDKLVDTLKQNDIWWFALGLNLVGKNMSEDSIPGQVLATFIVDLVRHKTLEEAYGENRRPYFVALNRREIAEMIPIPTEMYLHSKFF